MVRAPTASDLAIIGGGDRELELEGVQELKGQRPLITSPSCDNPTRRVGAERLGAHGLEVPDQLQEALYGLTIHRGAEVLIERGIHVTDQPVTLLQATPHCQLGFTDRGRSGET